MRHGLAGRQFSRNTPHRLALFRNMANSVIKDEQIITTVQKAKEVRRIVDRLITLGKSKEPHARRLAFDRTRDLVVVKKLFESLAPRYQSRSGGYTRVLRMSESRRGDGAEMAVLELVDHPVLDRKKKVKTLDSSKASKEDSQESTTQVKDSFGWFKKSFGKKAK